MKHSTKATDLSVQASVTRHWLAFSAALVTITLVMAVRGDAAAVTNIYTSVSNFPGAYILNPSAGNSQVDIWSSTNGASFTVTTNLSVNPAAVNSIATLLLDGSTNSVSGIGAPSLRAFNITGAGTGMVSLVNNASLTVTVYAELNSSGLGILSLSNSTMAMAAGGFGMAVDYSSSASSTNRLVMYNSTLNMNGQALTVGGSGGYGEAILQNSIITNAGLGVSSGNPNGSYGSLTVSNSALYTAGTYSLVVGASSNRFGSMIVNHSTWNGSGGHYLIGGFQGTGFNATSSTGFVALANGTVANLVGSIVSVGRAGAVGQLAVSNSSLTLGSYDIGGWQDAVPNEGFGGRGTVILSSGTNTVTGHAWLGSTSNTVASYSADGASLVVMPSVVVGYALTSTGTFTVAGTTTMFVTNAAHTAALEIGAGGKGSFIMNGGTLNADKLLVSNGASSTFTLNAGTVNTRSTTVSNGAAFVVGDGVQSATLDLVSGSHLFADGLTVASNGTLKGAATLTGNVTIQDGGILAPGNSPGTLTNIGNLTLSSGSVLNFELGPHNASGIGFVGLGSNDLVQVNGNLVLDGLLDVTAIFGFGPFSGAASTNVFRLFNYTGSLTDNGLSIRTLPALMGWVDTSVAGQVNLFIIPEPSSVALLVSGAIALTAITRRKRRHELSSR